MKIVNIIGLFFLIGIVTSCSTDLKVDPVRFEVSASSGSYKVGDTVHFEFEGSPDMITFYSGEKGNNYDFIDRTLAEGIPVSYFNAMMQYGTHLNTLHVLLSKDFNGNYNAAGVQSANWVDLTDNFKLPQNASVLIPTDTVALDQFVKPGETFYLGFHFVDTSGNGAQRTWTISDFNINLIMEDHSVTSIANTASAEWQQVKVEGLNDWKIEDSKITLTGGKPTDPNNDNWLISKSLNPNSVDPDRGVAIKDISQDISEFDYVFSEAGTYHVVFKAVNAAPAGIKELIKVIDLTIAE